MAAGVLEGIVLEGIVLEGIVLKGIVLKDRRSTYRDGSRAGWSTVKDPSWYLRGAWRFDRW